MIRCHSCSKIIKEGLLVRVCVKCRLVVCPSCMVGKACKDCAVGVDVFDDYFSEKYEGLRCVTDI